MANMHNNIMRYMPNDRNNTSSINTPSPTGLENPFEFPPSVNPEDFQQYLAERNLSRQRQPDQQALEQGRFQNQNAQFHMGVENRGMLSAHPNGVLPTFSVNKSRQAGGDVLNKIVLEEISTQNNNAQNCRNKNEDAPGPTESEKRLCPGGCGVYIPVDSSVFKIHIKGTHRMGLGPGWNWFLKRHRTMPKQGEKKQKLVKCSGCGTVYKELEEVRKCQAKHAIDQIGKKKENRGKTKENTPPPVVSTERLRCEFPGCKDKKGFLNQETLGKHQRKSHNLYRAGEESGNFICPFCDKGFHSSWNRNRHVSVCQKNPAKEHTTQGPSSSLPSARANNGETSPPESSISANGVDTIFRSQQSSSAPVRQSSITTNVPMSHHSQFAPGQTPAERQSSNFASLPMNQQDLIFSSLQQSEFSRYDGNPESEMSFSQKSTEGMLL